MTSISINKHLSDSVLKSHFIDRFAKKTVFKILTDLRVGQLTLYDVQANEPHSFGDFSSDLKAEIYVRHSAMFRKIMLGGTIGAAEAYMVKAWDTPSLLNVVRVMVANIEQLTSMDTAKPWLVKLSHYCLHSLNRNTKNKSQQNIAAHYDLGNDFFSLMLDPSMMYSAAIFPAEQSSLAAASKYKLKIICDKLSLQASDHLLEIGTGWGGLAIYAAKHYGCKVTTTTISQQQYEYACQAVADAELSNQITVLLEDYRQLSGQYDKLVSVEMIEAVGPQYYSTFFNQCSRLLKKDGLMLLQAITIADQRYQHSQHNVDFIQRYIFPGGSLPSNTVITQHIGKDTDMLLVDFHDIGLHYARTLAAWRKAFFNNIDTIKSMGFDDIFCRMWEFYLCYCEGGFTERSISTGQFLLAKPRASICLNRV